MSGLSLHLLAENELLKRSNQQSFLGENLVQEPTRGGREEDPPGGVLSRGEDRRARGGSRQAGKLGNGSLGTDVAGRPLDGRRRRTQHDKLSKHSKKSSRHSSQRTQRPRNQSKQTKETKSWSTFCVTCVVQQGAERHRNVEQSDVSSRRKYVGNEPSSPAQRAAATSANSATHVTSVDEKMFWRTPSSRRISNDNDDDEESLSKRNAVDKVNDG